MALLSSNGSMNQASLVAVKMLEDGKISICSYMGAYGKSGRCHFAAELTFESDFVSLTKHFPLHSERSKIYTRAFVWLLCELLKHRSRLPQ